MTQWGYQEQLVAVLSKMARLGSLGARGAAGAAQVLVALLLLLQLLACEGMRVDCCLSKWSGLGSSCSIEGTAVGNQTYYCVTVAESCTSCALAVNTSSSSCYQCCAEEPTSCGLPFSYISTSSWTLICIIFAGSCCCCSLVFLSAEQSRMKEGITFREAYLLPIPLVAADLNFDDKDYLFPPDQPTAIARAHNSIDVPVAEPTEHAALLGATYFPPERSIWD